MNNPSVDPFAEPKIRIEYFVDERRTGRTNNIVEDLRQEVARGKRVLVIAHDSQIGKWMLGLLHDKLPDNPHVEKMVCTTKTMPRGTRIDTLYLDHADYLDRSIGQIIHYILPSRVVVVVEGTLYSRINLKESA